MSVLQGRALQPIREQAYAPALSANKRLPCAQLQVFSKFHFDILFLYHAPMTDSLSGISDLSVWCFSCDSYIDAQVLPQLRPVYETAYILKFGEAPPIRNVELQNVAASSAGN